MIGIYIITNTINKKVYIGQTRRDIWQRLKMEHETDLVYDRHYNKHLQRAWNKYTKLYGYECFTFATLEECDDDITIEELNQKETDYIAKYQSNNPQYGYNLTPGGDTVSIEAIEKGLATKYYNNKDTYVSWRSADICRYRRPPKTQEAKQKQSKKMKGKEPWNKGRKMTDEEKAIRKIKMRGRNAWNKGLTKKDYYLE